jgi:GT2 family glycosyltransferase
LSNLRIRILRVATRTLSPVMPPLRSFLSSRSRVAHFAQQLLDRFDLLQDVVLSLFRGDPRERYERWIAAYDTVTDADFALMRHEQSRFSEARRFSLIVPLANTSEESLAVLAQSLLAQVYERWEVDFVPMMPVDERAVTFVAEAGRSDSRFRPITKREQLTADAWNDALKSGVSEFVILVDPGISLRPHALFLLARTIERYPDATLVYADDDVIDETGFRSDHYFKPDWNEALLRCQNYLGGFVAFRRSLALEVGGCAEELDGDCAWGLFLRMTAGGPPATIHHLPFVLSHRRTGHPAGEPGADGARRERVARALERRIARVGYQAQVEPVGDSSYRTQYALPDREPSVSIVIPSTCKLEFLRPCLDGVLKRTSYSELEVLLVVNGIRESGPEQREYLNVISAEPQVRVLPYENRSFNFSMVNNWAVGQARGELVCFLNDDTEVIRSDWLSAMVAHVRDRVAAVGAMLFYPNERIQHAGVLLGPGGVAAHMYSRRRRGVRGYHDCALVDQDVSCVTAACMLVRRDIFLDLEGFDEAFAIAFNDVDLCLRLREAGWRIVWTPSAELYHKESASIGRHNAGDREDEWILESDLMRSRWGEDLLSDPHYNPNLSLDPLQLWEPAFPPRVSPPWRTDTRERGIDRVDLLRSYRSRPSGGTHA